jgi:hypothetical protein
MRRWVRRDGGGTSLAAGGLMRLFVVAKAAATEPSSEARFASIVGPDPLPYGLEENRIGIGICLRCAAQHLLVRALTVLKRFSCSEPRKRFLIRTDQRAGLPHRTRHYREHPGSGRLGYFHVVRKRTSVEFASNFIILRALCASSQADMALA